MNQDQPISLDQARAEFQRLWGYADFRPSQAAIINSLLSQRDALIVLPTGAGKSICFQLPAILQTGLTLVISPLIALMENQVAELRQRHLPAASFHSQLSPRQRQQTLRMLEAQALRLLYLSPESLLSQAIWQRLCAPTLKLNGLILDEAHCLVQWGDTFRPTYRRLGAVRPALLKMRPGASMAIAAFTATADPQTQQTLRTVLRLNQPAIFQQSPHRENLTLQVQTCWTPKGRRQQGLKLIQAHPGQSGLVYVRSRKTCESLAAWLQKQGHNTVAYHGGLPAPERRQVESNWLKGEIPFVVCTSAFGLGINKPNVRWILHFHPTLTLPEYVQEVGRGGRDGQPAIALSLISEPTGWLDPEDQQRRQFFTTQQRSQQAGAFQLAQTLPKQGDVDTVVSQHRQGAIALALLHTQGKLRWLDPFHYQLCGSGDQQPNLDPNQPVQQMQQYLRTRRCRWRFLLKAFGFTSAANWRCGHCDNCRSR